jgi:hypothetical protein
MTYKQPSDKILNHVLCPWCEKENRVHKAIKHKTGQCRLFCPACGRSGPWQRSFETAKDEFFFMLHGLPITHKLPTQLLTNCTVCGKMLELEEEEHETDKTSARKQYRVSCRCGCCNYDIAIADIPSGKKVSPWNDMK